MNLEFKQILFQKLVITMLFMHIKDSILSQPSKSKWPVNNSGSNLNADLAFQLSKSCHKINYIENVSKFSTFSTQSSFGNLKFYGIQI